MSRKLKSLISITGNVALIALTGVRANGAVAVVDIEDVDLGYGYSWWANPKSWPRQDSYAAAFIDGKCVSLHRHIMQVAPGVLVDHVDHNSMNCRRSNLRLCNPSQNMANRRKIAVAASQFKGVTRLPHGMWRARISDGGGKVSLGCFQSESMAATAYNEAATAIFGSFPHLNHPIQVGDE